MADVVRGAQPLGVVARPATMRDGAVVELRPVTPQDGELLGSFLAGLSDESRALRFLSAGIDARTAGRALAKSAGVGLLAFEGTRLIGHGCLIPTEPDSAEVAFAVADAAQGLGLATLLLERLVEAAQRLGITRLTAEVDPYNHQMVTVFEDIGLPVTVRLQEGVLHVEMTAALDAEGRARVAERHRLATVAGLRHVLRPEAIAVIGGSERTGSVGAALLDNILCGGYRGSLHLVHPRATTLRGIPTRRRVADLPCGIDLAIIAVPAAAVIDVARDCAVVGVRALLVISAGFGEAGVAGRRREAELLGICREAGIRLVGPNCLGVTLNDPDVRLNATFAAQKVRPGRIALASQSGGVGIVAMDLAERHGTGLASFVSLGDRADVSSNDLLRAWAADDGVEAIALYLESFGNPRAFAGVAREVARRKPIVAVKAGRSPAGSRAAASHTGALVEGADELVDVLLADAGVTRVDTVAELLDAAAVLADGRIGLEPRVAILTNAGGAGIACSDACEHEGVRLARLTAATRKRVRADRPEAATGNPIDLIAGATAEHFSAAFAALADDPGVDVVIAIHVETADEDGAPTAAVAAAAPRADLPVIVVPLAQTMPRGIDGRVVVIDTPEAAARAVGHAAARARWLARPEDQVRRPSGVNRAAGAAVIAEAIAHGDDWLAPDRARRLAEAYRLPLAPARLATTPDGVAAAAAELNGHVALKAIAPGLIHKTDAGAVRLDLADPQAARLAATELDTHLRALGFAPSGFLVQQMMGEGVELLVGALNHSSFGPIVACGAGGTLAELLDDVGMRLAPLGRRTARDLVGELRTAKLLDGWRGAPRCDVGAVVDVVTRMATLIDDRPEIAELEINPLIATPGGVSAVDLRVRLRGA
jgi:acyl-CoA synthetase (NDP forming)/GNAT superfamily N-acetyltransferase